MNQQQKLVAPGCFRLQNYRQSSRSKGSDGEGVYHPPADLEPPIPEYKPRSGESIEVQKARLLYQSRKRGMLENGLLLRYYLSLHFTSPDRLIIHLCRLTCYKGVCFQWTFHVYF